MSYHDSVSLEILLLLYSPWGGGKICDVFLFALFLGIPRPIIVLKIGFAISPYTGVARDAISPKGIAPPFWVFFFLFFLLPPMYQTPFFIDYFPLSIKNGKNKYKLN